MGRENCLYGVSEGVGGRGGRYLVTNATALSTSISPVRNLSNIAIDDNAQYEKRVSTSPHLSPVKEPFGCCRDAMYCAMRS